MSRLVKYARTRIGTSVVGALVAAVMALGLSGAAVTPAAAQGLSPLELCLMLFPNGISGGEATEAALQGSGLSPEQIQAIVSAASAGDMTCYDIFGGAPPTEPPVEPTQPPAQPTQAPAQPTQAPAQPTQAPTQAPAQATTAATVTTMPTTGTGSSAGFPAVGVLAALATILAAVAGVALRMTAPRR